MCYDFDFVNADSWTVRETIDTASPENTIVESAASDSSTTTPEKRAAPEGIVQNPAKRTKLNVNVRYPDREDTLKSSGPVAIAKRTGKSETATNVEDEMTRPLSLSDSEAEPVAEENLLDSTTSRAVPAADEGQGSHRSSLRLVDEQRTEVEHLPELLKESQERLEQRSTDRKTWRSRLCDFGAREETREVRVAELEKALREAGNQCDEWRSQACRLEAEEQNRKAAAQELQQELQETCEERDEWRLQACRLEAEEQNRETTAQKLSTANTTTMKTTMQKVGASMKEKWQSKMAAQHEKADEKYSDLRDRANAKVVELKERHGLELQKKDAAHKKNKDEQNAKHTKEVGDLKNQIKDMKEDRKKETEELGKLKKALKEEQREEIKKHKPDTAAAVKEKDEALKEKGKEIRKLQDEIGKLKEESDTVQAGVAALAKTQETLLQAVDNHMSLRKVLTERLAAYEANARELIASSQVLSEEYEKRLQIAGERWQKQYDTAQYHAKTADEHRRGLFVLRSSHERMVTQNEDLRKTVRDSTAEVRRLRAEKVASTDRAMKEGQGMSKEHKGTIDSAVKTGTEIADRKTSVEINVAETVGLGAENVAGMDWVVKAEAGVSKEHEGTSGGAGTVG